MSYEVVPLNFTPWGINDGGQVAGQLFDGGGVIWDSGVEEVFQSGSILNAINDQGWAAGGLNDTIQGIPEAMVFEQWQIFNLAALVGEGTMCMDINESGNACGQTVDSQYNSPAFLYRPGQTNSLAWINPQYSDGLSAAWAVNDNNDVVGGCSPPSDAPSDWLAYVGFFYSNGSSIPLGPGTWAFDLNNNRQIAGCVCQQSGGSFNFQAAVWDANSPQPSLTRIGTPENYFGVEAAAINSSGVVVGSNSTSAFICYSSQSTTAVDLNTLISDPHWRLTEATDINDSGQIVGSGVYNKQPMGFLLKPIVTVNVPGQNAAGPVFYPGGVPTDAGLPGVLPGGQPVPPDPWGWLSQDVQQTILGLMIDDLAASVNDSEAREVLRRTALRDVRARVNRRAAAFAARNPTRADHVSTTRLPPKIRRLLLRMGKSPTNKVPRDRSTRRAQNQK